jgi:hypothetical protein
MPLLPRTEHNIVKNLFAGLFLNALTYHAISALGSRVPRRLPRLSDRAFGILSGVIPSEERPT